MLKGIKSEGIIYQKGKRLTILEKIKDARLTFSHGSVIVFYI